MRIKTILCAFLLFPMLLASAIFETSRFEDVLAHISLQDPAKILIACDIDNTLLRGSQQLGSVAWGDNMVEQLERKGIPKEDAEKIVSILWDAVQPYIIVEIVDPHAPKIIREIQSRKITIMGLTARCPYEVDYTHRQLTSLGIHFQGDSLPEKFFLNEQQASYQYGVLFATPFNKKSKTLFTYLDAHSIEPECILFVDDKWSHVNDLAKACEERGIAYIGIRFSGADEAVNNFDPRIAQIQWEAFPCILSDEQARALDIKK